jgi:beta-phosphoglucomutase
MSCDNHRHAPAKHHPRQSGHLTLQSSTRDLEAVIFDMDGVLVDTEPIYDQATTELLAELGVAADPVFFDSLRGLPVLEVWTALVRRYSLPQPVEALARESSGRLDALIAAMNGLEPMAGVNELISGLRARRIPLGVASSSRPSRIAIILSRLDLHSAFDVALSGDEVSRGKPDPEIFLTTAARLDARASRTVVIEDSERGVEAALRAGMRCVAVGSAISSATISNANLVVASLTELDAERLVKMVP